MAPGWSAAARDVISTRATKGSGLLDHHVWARPSAVHVHVQWHTMFLSPYNVTKCCTQHGPLGSGRISRAPNPISSEVKLGSTSSDSHVQNLNQISSQSSGISATLHLTLKWEQVVLMDYRWLIMGWQRSGISPEIHLHLILLTIVYLQVYHSVFLSLHPSFSCTPSGTFSRSKWNIVIHILIRNIISNKTSGPLCTLAT